MKQKLIKGIIIYAICFALLFFLRICYGIFTNEGAAGKGISNYYVNQNIQQQEQNKSMEEVSSKTNYASLKRKVQKQLNESDFQTITVDQKYEKVADIKTGTPDFDRSEKDARDLIKKHEALIQYEQNSGLKGYRKIDLMIGVDPEKFDIMTDDIKKIGSLISMEINKIDKTNEYKSLNAKKATLEETRRSLLYLKNMSGRIEEYISLETKITEVNKALQELGVSLGNFDVENEFCTIKFSISENSSKSGFSFGRILIRSFEWTVKYYSIITITAFFGLLGILILLVIIEKLKIYNLFKTGKVKKKN